MQATRLSSRPSSAPANHAPSHSHSRSLRSTAKTAPEARDDLQQMAHAEAVVHVGRHAHQIHSEDNVFDPKDLSIKNDIIRMIAQYLGDEGFSSSKLTLLDEANIKAIERDENSILIKRIKKSILDGDWPEIDAIVANNKQLIKNQKAFLFAVYRQQFLEYIEHHEMQKAFTHLMKRLKPLEHYQTTPQEFRDMSYLLTAKSVQDVPSFKNWEGIGPSREKLLDLFQTILETDTLNKHTSPSSTITSTHMPPHRLLTLLNQSVCYQIEFARYHPRVVAPTITTLLQNFRPVIIPNTVCKTMHGHTGTVKCAEFVGELGKLVVSGSTDYTCRIWETESGSCVGSLEGHEACVWDVASDLRGSFVASGSGDGSVKIWDVAKMQCSATLQASESDIYSVEYHPGNKHIVIGGYDSVIRLYDIERGTVMKTFSGHGLPVTKAIFNPIGNLIVSASKDSTIKFWDIVSGLCIKTIKSHLSEVTSVAISTNGLHLLSSSKDNSNRLWDLRTQSSLKRFKGAQNTSKNFIRASFAGTLVVGGSEDSMVHVWDAERGTLLSRLGAHGGVCYGGVWNDGQSLLLSCSDDRTLKTWWFDATKPVVSQY